MTAPLTRALLCRMTDLCDRNSDGTACRDCGCELTRWSRVCDPHNDWPVPEGTPIP